MKIFTAKYIALLSVVLVLGMMTSCNKVDSSGTVQEQIDSLKVGLIAYYPFNNSGVDESGNGNHGMVYNVSSVPDRNGKPNYAYHFDGVTSYISVLDNPALRLANTNITLSTWVKLDAYNPSYGCNILTKHITGSNNGWAWGITGTGGTAPKGIVTYGPGGNSLLAQGTTVIALNQWHMVTSVYNLATQQLSIYVDGTLNNVSTNILSPNPAITTSLYIGRDDPTVPTNGYFFQGALDDLRIYNRALTAIEVKKLFVLTY